MPRKTTTSKDVHLLLAVGWPVDARGEYGMTPLQWASWRYKPQLELNYDHGITALRFTGP
jgi:hypothetical protein